MEKVVPTETKVTPWKNTLKTFLLFISIAAIIVSVILLSLLQLQPPKVLPRTPMHHFPPTEPSPT